MTETPTLFALAFIAIFGICAGIYHIAARDYDHEQMAVSKSITWELRSEK